MRLEGLPFFKMSGSGNDFVVFDDRSSSLSELERVEVVQSICARRTGIGADGVVLLRPEPGGQAAFRMIYINADGTRAAMCGNAALCSTRLGVELGLGAPAGYRMATDSGLLGVRIVEGHPEIDLAPIDDIQESVDIPPEPGEIRMGYADAGVPHLVVRCASVETVDVHQRGGSLRHEARFPNGANVDFVAPDGPRWAMRTFERGVEGETLACGTGAVSTALMLAIWGESGEVTTIRTRSGADVRVRLERREGAWRPSLSGEGRIVYQGELREIG